MTKAIRILQPVFVNYFYRVNAGLFAFAFFVLFGMPYSPLAFHLSLITGIIQSPVFLGCVLVGWFLYNLKCADYILKQLHNPRQAFLACLNCLPRHKTYLYFLYVQVLVYLPILLYAIVIDWIAFTKHEWVAAVEIIAFNAAILLATPLCYVVALRNQSTAVKPMLLSRLSFTTKKPLFLLPIYFLLIARKQMILVTKLFSLFLLYLFIKLYEPEGHDIRPIQLCLLVNAAAHSAIVFEIRSFEEEFLGFAKNLPLTTSSRFVRMAAMLSLLLLPEFIFLARGINVQFALIDYPQLLLFVVALLCMFQVVLLLDDYNTDQYLKVVFGVMVGCFFIILYNPGIFLPIAILALAFGFFNSYYYNNEQKLR